LNLRRRVGAPRRSPTSLAGALALVHPAPSLLVTACFVATAASAHRRRPEPSTILRLVLVMLPLQLAIGALNDLCDLDLDRLAKPAKPLVAGTASASTARALTAAGVGVGLASAATFGAPTLALAAGCAASGIAYDLGLKRGRLSWLPWWTGFTCLPLCAWAAAGRLSPRPAAAAPPLALLLALSLHLANAAPDAADDLRAGSTGLAARLGAARARRLSCALAAAAAAAAPAMAPALGQPVAAVGAGAAPLLGTALALALQRRARPFPPLAAATAVLIGVWVVTLPRDVTPALRRPAG
jgi:4-hydroxybenzoate polyprenyltransferase